MLRLAATAALPAYTPHTICRLDRLHHALHRIRCDGLAVDRGELVPDTCTVAVPALGPGNVAIAAVEVEVDDLAADTVAAVTPALTLAAHALIRELHPDWWRGTAGAPFHRVTRPRESAQRSVVRPLLELHALPFRQH